MENNIKIYDGNEWELVLDEYFDYDRNIYIDMKGNYITGFLNNFHYYDKNNIKNYQYVKNGKRSDKYKLSIKNNE